MQHFVEYVRVRVTPENEQEYLAARPGAVAAIAEAIPGFIAAPVFAKVSDQEWTDVWIYDTQANADTANDRAADIPGFMKMASLLEIVSIETGTMPVA
jgi:antibiotic biosynthesis monooxygenase (ABM) superfamily enzyme